DAPLPPDLAARPIERGAHRRAIVGAPAEADELAADMVGDRDEEIGVARRCGDRPPHLLGKLGRHPLIGVDLDDPVAAAGGDPGGAALALELPRTLDDARAEAARDLRRAVG